MAFADQIQRWWGKSEWLDHPLMYLLRLGMRCTCDYSLHLDHHTTYSSCNRCVTLPQSHTYHRLIVENPAASGYASNTSRVRLQSRMIPAGANKCSHHIHRIDGLPCARPPVPVWRCMRRRTLCSPKFGCFVMTVGGPRNRWKSHCSIYTNL